MSDDVLSGGSRFELLARCRAKIEQADRVYAQGVPRQIASMNRTRRLRAGAAGDAVRQLDLEAAILNGVIPTNGYFRDKGGNWNIVINGTDTRGMDMAVTVHLSDDAEDPLLIDTFVVHH